MAFQKSWCTGEERSIRMELALRTIDRLERRLSFQAPWSLAALGLTLVLLCTELVFLIVASPRAEDYTTTAFILLSAFYIASTGVLACSFVLCFLSLGFFQKRHHNGNLLHPYHHHRLPCSREHFAERFTTTTLHQFYLDALQELHLLRINGKTRFRFLKYAYLCLGSASLLLVFATMITIL
jgi:hypothetical protein